MRPRHASISAGAASEDEGYDDQATFDCNICLDRARKPIVTLCGHLYCSSCIDKWLRVGNETRERPTCPVCKQDTRLVPIYGRGASSSNSWASTLHTATTTTAEPLEAKALTPLPHILWHSVTTRPQLLLLVGVLVFAYILGGM